MRSGMTSFDFRITPALSRDRATVLALLAERSPGTDVRRRHAWLYEQNPHGPAVTYLALGARGAPIGLTSLFPRRALIDGALGVASIGGDGYVRPAFRCRGVATALHRACLDAMRPGAVELMCCGPQPETLPALKRAGSREITSLRRFTRPRGWHRFVASLGRLSLGTPPRLVELRGLDRRVAEVWERASEGMGVLLVRDPEHYAWRFGATSRGSPRGYAVVEGGRTTAICALEQRGREVAVLDFLAPRHRRAAALRALAQAVEAEALTMAVCEAGDAAGDLLRAGFLPGERRGLQVLAPEDHPARETLMDPTRWYYTWGDGVL
jgi:GNAT superfamily N-acetyltransferase